MAILKTKQLKCIKSNLLLLSLSVADLCSALGPTVFYFVSLYHAVDEYASQMVCNVILLLTFSFSFVSVVTLMMISVDRFLAIKYPFRYQRQVANSTLNCMLFYPWLQGFITSIPAAIFHRDSASRQPGLPCRFDWNAQKTYTAAVMTMNYLIPTTLVVSTNAVVFRVARKQLRAIHSCTARFGTEESHASTTSGAILTTEAGQRPGILYATIRIVISTSLMIIGLLLSWLPFLLPRIMLTFSNRKPSNTLYLYGICSAFSHGAFDSVIILVYRKDIRNALFRLCSTSYNN